MKTPTFRNLSWTIMALLALLSPLTLVGAKQQLGEIPANQNVVTEEEDTVFTTWKNIYFPQIMDTKLDATNGVAFGTLYIYPEAVPGGHVGDGHAILDNEGLRFTSTTMAPDITYSLNGISALYPGGNEQWYYFDNTTNGIARLKDVPVIPTITTNGVDVSVTSDNKINIAIPDVPIKSVTTNGTEFSVREGVVTIPLDEYVKLKDLQEGITFDNLSATNLTVNGKQVDVQGHKHVVSDIDDLKGLWSIPGAEAAASNAIERIEGAQNMNEVKNAMIEFLQNFKKPTE